MGLRGFGLLVLLALGALPTARGETRLFIAFWNVENLFDTANDPLVEGDEEFTPTADKKWTEERLGEKLTNLAKVISEMNAGRGPEVLGLSEIENRAVLEMLVARLAPLARAYEIVHQDSPSGRGIDCALLFDRNRLTLARHDFLRSTVTDTRDVVEAQLTFEGAPLTVFVNHWPSRVGDQTGEQRETVAARLRQRIDELLAADRTADIVVLGDLNDHPHDASVARRLGATISASSMPAASTQPTALVNTVWPIHVRGEIGSYKYDGRWEMIDHVIISQGLIDPRGLSWKPDSTAVFVRDFMLYKPGTPDARPNRSYGGDRYYGGYSDHLPVVCELVAQP